MNTSLSPARFYRDAVRQLCIQFRPDPGEDTDTQFRRYLERQYEHEKEQLESLAESNAPAALLTPVRNGIFILAVGLLSFGRLDMVDDILNNIPRSGDVQRLVLGLQAMLPLAGDFDPRRHPNEIRQWVSANRSRLKWDENQGKFLLIEP